MDWVKARLDCSPDHIWSAVCDRIKDDVERWGELTKSQQKINITRDDRMLRVSRPLDPEGSIWGTLKRENRHLILQTGVSPAQLTSDMIKDRKLVPMVNSKGECCLILEDKELQVWQVSQMVLQLVLF